MVAIQKATLPLWRNVLLGALLVEIPTAVARFGFGLESTRDTASSIGRFTFGMRLHHGYLGVLLLIISLFLAQESRWREPAVIVGGALTLSDAIHHFIVLWIFTGSPQFDFWYPGI